MDNLVDLYSSISTYMFKKIILFILVFFNPILVAIAQKNTVTRASDMKPSFQLLLLNLSTTYFTVVKENQVDLDSSLIHVSHSLSLSRLPVVADGINDESILSKAQWVDQRKPSIGQQQLNAATGLKHAELLILMGAYFAFEPVSDTSASTKGIHFLNQGLKECGKLNNTPLQLAAQRLLGKVYLKKNDFNHADKLFATANDGYIKSGNQLGAGTTCSWWGLYAPVTATSSLPRIKHIEMALNLYKAIDNKEGQINALINEAYVHVLLYNFQASFDLAKKAFVLTKLIEFPYAHYVTDALCAITLFQGKFGEPLSYGIQAAETAEMTKDSIGLPYFYGTVASLYENEQNREEVALIWEKKAISCFMSQHEPCYANLDAVVANLLIDGKKNEALVYIKKLTNDLPPVSILDSLYYNLSIGDYYGSIKQWKQAHKFLNQALITEDEIEKHGLNIRRPIVLIDIANLYFLEKNYKQAKSYFNQYLNQKAAITGGIFSARAEALSALITIDSTERDYKAELRDYNLYTDILVRNYTVSKTMLAEELQVKYATADRINQIKILDQKARLEQDNLKKANQVKNITISGIILLVIIALLLYRQNKVKQKTNNLINRKNELMQKLLDEKEWLIKEIHHRVKNNLHTIICLLESQAAFLDNDALKAIETSQHRIYAMSLIHQKLYQSDDIKVLDMHTYLTEFVHYLRESFGSPDNIQVILHAEHINLGAVQAIPIGLIINEAVNNSFKYAFPKKRKGKIEITLERIADEIYLSVIDNGVGFDHITDQEQGSLGLELIKGLTLDLRGTLAFDATNGTSIEIRFKVDNVGVPLEDGAGKSLKPKTS